MRNHHHRHFHSLTGLLLLLLVQVSYGQSNLPDKPLLKYVSVDTIDQCVMLEWSPSSTPGILGYKIYSLDISTFPETGTLIDSVAGNTYFYKHSNALPRPLTYTITAVDAVGESLLSGDYHRPVSVTATYDSCHEKMILNWEKYIGWKGNHSGYRVYSREGSDNFSKIGLLDTTLTEFVIEEIQENVSYSFLVEAFDNRSNISFSNISSYFTEMPPPPNFINLDYVTVLDDQTVEISFSTDLSGEINDFRLLRANGSPTSFTGWTNIINLDQTPYSFNDQIATPGIQVYYRIDALNSCMNPVSSSNLGTNIVLKGGADGTVATLTWNPYTDFKGELEAYNIYRLNEFDEFEYVNSVAPESVSYIEDLSQVGDGRLKGEISYMIEAVESDNNPYGIKGFSRSNKLTISVETKLFVPNAFSPNNDGMNDLFMPVLDFSPADYRLYIYDRSGKMLYFTDDPYNGWDGSLNGSSMAKQGVYVYHIEYTSYSGTRKIITGNLSLVTPLGQL